MNQVLSASAVHNSLIQKKKTVRTLYFWCSFALLELLYIAQSDCRRYSAANLLEVLLDEDEFRSFLTSS